MQIGVDSYVSITDANNYVGSHYTSTSEERVLWESLSDEDKSILLVSSCSEIDMLPFRGHAYEENQPLAFPRILWGCDYPPVVPESIKQAQIEYALFLSDTTGQKEQTQRAEMQRQGVTSFSIGDLSEAYNGAALTGPEACQKAANLLSKFSSGGYWVC